MNCLALGISLGLRQYFIVSLSSRHDTDSVLSNLVSTSPNFFVFVIEIIVLAKTITNWLDAEQKICWSSFSKESLLISKFKKTQIRDKNRSALESSKYFDFFFRNHKNKYFSFLFQKIWECDGVKCQMFMHFLSSSDFGNFLKHIIYHPKN